MSAIQGILRVAAQLTPTLKNSKFKETGVLTPEEFVAAGDFLVFKCPTWTWQAGEEGKRLSYLPPDKQFLMTKKVPCTRRVKAMEYTEDDEPDDETAVDGEEAWITTHNSHVAKAEVAAEVAVEVPQSNAAAPNEDEEVDLDNIPDIDALDLENNLVEEEDPAALKTTGGDDIVKSRTYDLSITYDNYYRTPRVWLYGYNEQDKPLRPDEIYEDISQDHAKKTVTIEPHPHLSLNMASIHPCKDCATQHANVMKRILNQLDESGRELRVDQYMIVFLKFVSAIIPTIEYDFTISSDAQERE